MELSLTKILYVYTPTILLLLLAFIKNRFEPRNETLKKQNWSFTFVIAVVGLFTTAHIGLSLWHWVPRLRTYEYNLFYWLVASIFIVVLIYASLRFIYKVSIIDIFNLKVSYLTFIIKLCIIFTLIVVLDYYLIGFDLSDQQEFERMKSADTKNLIVYSLDMLIVGPILEETIYRGILYVPLYRKVGRYLAMIITSFVWTFGHFYDLSTSIYVFILGLIFAWLYDRSGSLLHPIIFHMFKNNWLIYYILPV